MVRERADWSRRLPRPLVIPSVMTLKTLGDVRTLMWHLPEHRRGAFSMSALDRQEFRVGSLGDMPGCPGHVRFTPR